MNTLEFKVVPLVTAVNEDGSIFSRSISSKNLNKFLDAKVKGSVNAQSFNRAKLLMQAKSSTAAKAELAREIFHREPKNINQTISLLQEAIKLEPGNGRYHFMLGVALRRRYESSLNKQNDSQASVDAWSKALALQPNNYIWRRRIQQYGPRLDKPYNFYYWIKEAREDIRKRGEKPIELVAEPMGSEIAGPSKTKAKAVKLKNPDPDGKINRDEGLVNIETLITPPQVKGGGRVRVRVSLNVIDKAHWNNEVDDLLICPLLPKGLSFVEQSLEYPNPKSPESNEIRHLEFELEVAKNLKGKVEIPVYSLFYVCEEKGQCLYLRKDFKVELLVK